MATTTLAPPPVKIAPFPLAAVEAKLRDELVEAVKIEVSIRGMSVPAAPADGRLGCSRQWNERPASSHPPDEETGC